MIIKKILITGFCFVTLFSGVNFSHAIEATPHRIEKTLSDIDSVIENALETFNVPGAAVGIVVDGEVVLAKGYGLRDRKQALPVTEKTLFAIGSCTKAFTTFVLGTLVDEGKISWDDPVIKHIPEFRLWDQHATEKITIRDLITHRCGLPRHDFLWFNSEFSREDLLTRLQYLEPVCDLREKFFYNNLMYCVAGILIERVTGQTWEENVQSSIFDPLEMKDSNFSVQELQRKEDFSLPYVGEMQAIPFRDISNVGPAGSINANVSDMVKWMQAQLFDSPLIKQETLQEIQSLQMANATFPKESVFRLGYGMGWWVGMYKGHYFVDHEGCMDGFFARVSFLPQEKIGVVILTNSTDGDYLVSSIANVIFDKLLGEKESDWISQAHEQMITTQQKKDPEVKKSIEQPDLITYVGNYEHPGYGTVHLYIEENQLKASFNHIVTPLDFREGDTFEGSKEAKDPVFSEMEFSFFKDDSGNVSELHVPLEPTVHPIAFKKVFFS